MSVKVWYQKDAVVAGQQWLDLQDGGVQPTIATGSSGWTNATVASGQFAKLDSLLVQPTGAFGATALPAAPLDAVNGDAFRSPLLNGHFAAGTWELDFWMVGSATNGAVRTNLRLYKSANADGSGATQITSAAQVGSTMAVSAAQGASVVRFNPGELTLNNEYLFIQLALEIVTAGTVAGATVKLCLGGKIATADWTQKAASVTSMRGFARYRPTSGRRYIHASDVNPPELPWLAPDADWVVPIGATVHDVPDSGNATTNGTNFVTAMNAAADGDVVQVHPGVRYNLSDVFLPQRSNWTYVVVASKMAGTFPLASSLYHIGGTQTQGVRAGPQHSFATLGTGSPLAQFVLPDSGTHSNVASILQATIGGGGWWWFEGIEFMLEETLTTGCPAAGLVSLGTTDSSTNWYPSRLQDIPTHFNFGHCLFHGTLISATAPGTFSNGPRRAITVNASHVGVRDSSAYYIQVNGTEAQALGGWNTPGVFGSYNNFVSGSAQSILFGGSPPYVSALQMRNFTTKWNHLWKDIRWFVSQGQTVSYGCKNHYEHKNGTHILVEDTVMEHNTNDGQHGESILFQNLLDAPSTPPANKITDVTVRNIKTYGGASCVELAGATTGDGSPVVGITEQPASRFLISNLLAEKAGGVLAEANHPGDPAPTYGFEIADSLRDVCIEHVSLEVPGSGVTFANLTSAFDLDSVTRLTYRNNIIGHGPVGSFAGDGGVLGVVPGTAGLNDSCKGYAIDRNVLYDVSGTTPENTTNNPANNAYPTAPSGVGFDANYVTGSPSALSGTSAYKGYGTDGADPGADVASIATMTTAVKSTTLPP